MCWGSSSVKSSKILLCVSPKVEPGPTAALFLSCSSFVSASVQSNHFVAHLTLMQPCKSTIRQCMSICFKRRSPQEYGKIENIKLHLS